MSDLTTLANAKQYLRIINQTDDLLISRIISAASDLAVNYINRDIMQQTYTENFTGYGNSFHMFQNYPVVSVISLTILDTVILPANNYSSNGYIFDEEQLVLQHYQFNRNRLVNKIVYVAGYIKCPFDIDIEQAVLELVAIKYKQIEHIDQSSKQVAGETVSFIVKDLPDFIKSVFNNYKKYF